MVIVIVVVVVVVVVVVFRNLVSFVLVLKKALSEISKKI